MASVRTGRRLRSRCCAHALGALALAVPACGDAASPPPGAGTSTGAASTSPDDSTGRSAADATSSSTDAGSSSSADATTTSATTETDGTSSGGQSRCGRGRQTVDRIDDTDLSQVHAMYVLASDSVDQEFDVDGSIANSLLGVTAWMAEASGGRALRLDTCDGDVDVTFVQLDRTEADLAQTGIFLRDELEAELTMLGFDGFAGNGKLYAVYYAGGNDGLTCGGGAFPPALLGTVGALYMGTTFEPPTPDCDAQGFAPPGQPLQYMDFVMLHELFHTLGAVEDCAPNGDGNAHTADLPSDLMYTGTEPWFPDVLDPDSDDYFDHGTDCLDVARSAFLEPQPEGAEMPPGWPVGGAGSARANLVSHADRHAMRCALPPPTP